MPTIQITSEAYSKLVDECKKLGTTIQDLASKYILDVLGYENEDEDDDAKNKTEVIGYPLKKKAVPLEGRYTHK